MGQPARTELRQRRLIEALPTSRSTAEAMRQAGYTDATATKQAGRTLAHVLGNPDNAAMLDAAGITKERVGAKLAKLLDASRTEFHQGAPVAEVDDNGTQLRAAELCLRLRGQLKDGADPAQIVLMVVQMVVPVVLPFVPEERRAELAAALEGVGQG